MDAAAASMPVEIVDIIMQYHQQFVKAMQTKIDESRCMVKIHLDVCTWRAEWIFEELKDGLISPKDLNEILGEEESKATRLLFFALLRNNNQ